MILLSVCIGLALGNFAYAAVSRTAYGDALERAYFQILAVLLYAWAQP